MTKDNTKDIPHVLDVKFFQRLVGSPASNVSYQGIQFYDLPNESDDADEAFACTLSDDAIRKLVDRLQKYVEFLNSGRRT